VSYPRYPRFGGMAPTDRLRPHWGILPCTTFENAGLAHIRDGRIKRTDLIGARACPNRWSCVSPEGWARLSGAARFSANEADHGGSDGDSSWVS
jgi:hypothetical protein